MAAVGIAEIGAEGGDFDFDAIARDEHDTELRAHAEAPRKELHDAIGRSVGSDVEVDGLAVEENVADAAAYEQGLVAMLQECGADRVG